MAVKSILADCVTFHRNSLASCLGYGLYFLLELIKQTSLAFFNAEITFVGLLVLTNIMTGRIYTSFDSSAVVINFDLFLLNNPCGLCGSSKDARGICNFKPAITILRFLTVL